MKKFSIGPVGAFARYMVPALVAAAGSTVAHAQCSGLSVTSSTGATITPGVTSIGNSGDDVTTNISLPFAVSVFGTSYTSAVISSNGNMQFTTGSGGYENGCLRQPDLGVALIPHWDDLRTDGAGRGVFTSVTGTAPNRVFNVEWRTIYFSGPAGTVNFQIRLYENNSRIEFVYGNIPSGGANATVGVQGPGAADFNQFGCNANVLSSGLMLTYTPVNSSTVLCASGGANPAGVANCNGASTLLTVDVSPGTTPPSTGLAVAANLTSIGGSSSQVFYDNGTNGDLVANDTVFSFNATVPSSVTAGAKSLPFSVSDLEGRTGTGTIALAVNCVGLPNPQLGPDVFTRNITDVPRWGVNAAGTIVAYSVGTTSDNSGDYPVLWVDDNGWLPDFDTTQHPVISQNMYRLRTYGTAPNQYSRFENLGQSWLKHGFVSTNSGAACQPSNLWRYSMQAYDNLGGDALGVNCTDTYGGSLNGSQSLLGPKHLVNATIGTSPFVRGTATGDSTVRARLQVPVSDVTGQPAGTRYFVDAFYVTGDDAQFVRAGQTVATNAMNNASWRELNASQINTGTSIAFVGNTQMLNPGIFAWRAADPAVTLVTADHDDAVNPGTGFRTPSGQPSFPGTTIRSRYWVGAKVTPLAGGLYRYEYAVYNHNSDRSANRITFPIPAGATVTDTTFHAPQWHSGEPYSNAVWTSNKTGNELTFSTESFAANENANALRWACLYNFGFTTDVAPTTGAAVIGLFKPGTVGAPESISAAGLPVPTVPPGCGPADVGSQGGGAGSDGLLDNNDFIAFIDAFFNLNMGVADLGGQGGLPGSDGLLDNNDFIAFINFFFEGC